MATKKLNTKIHISIWIAMILPFVGSCFYFIILDQSPLAKLMYGGVKVFTILWPLAIYFLLKNPTNLPSFSIKLDYKAIIQGLISGALIFCITYSFWELVFYEIALESKEVFTDKLESLGIKENFILFAIFISFIHSLIEEYYWRWFVYGSLANSLIFSKKLYAHLLAALAFTSHHIIILSQFFETPWVLLFSLGVFIGGVLWSHMYEVRKSLIGAWISHALVDIVLMLIGYKIINS